MSYNVINENRKQKTLQYIIYFIFFLIMVYTIWILTAHSQNVTDKSNTNYPTSTIRGTAIANITVIDAVGDIECSSKLRDKIMLDNPTLFVVLGDMCYQRDLTNFTITFSEFKKANTFECVIGNHDSEENGNSKILRQALDYCGDHWYRKIANNSTLVIGLNTNGNTSLQTNWGQSLVTNSSFMKGIKNVMLMAHKPAHTPPGSDHRPENSTVQMFFGIMNHIPSSIQVFEIAAHNHMMAESTNGQWFISGAGGRKLYNFTQDPDWSFVNNKEHGYLQIKINNTDGKILSTNFYGLDGRPIS